MFDNTTDGHSSADNAKCPANEFLAPCTKCDHRVFTTGESVVEWALSIAPAPLVTPSSMPSIVPQGELLRDNLRPYLQTPAVTPATNEVPLATPTTAIAPANYAWPVTPSVNNTPVISPATTSTPTVAWPPTGSTGLRLER